MGNIFAFLSKYHKIFLFLFLEIVSISLVINNNRTQHAVFFHWAYDVSGRMYKAYDDVNLYFHLKTVNDSLRAENARLRASQMYSKYADTTKKIDIQDTVFHQKFTYIPGRVVNNSVNNRNNYLTIDIGSIDGVSKHLGVVTTAGIVGVTRDISDHFCSVLSILHKDFTVSAEIAEMHEIGTAVWDGKNPELIILKDIPQHIRIRTGLHVVTSPYSNLFPQGTPIGTIIAFEVKPGDAFYTIYVKLSSDMRNVRQVYVVNNLLKTEQENLETQIPEEK